MDFTTAHDSPVVIRVNGQSYNVPRFLLPQMKQWAAERQQQTEDRATAHLDADGKARFLMYFQPPPVDVFDLASYARSPEGISDILDRQLKAAGVPDDVRKSLLEYGDPQSLAALSVQVTSAQRAEQSAKTMTEPQPTNKDGADPLTGRPEGSTGSASTGTTNEPTSTPATPASTQAA